MTRFFISADQASHLVLKAIELSQRGEIFILKMPSINLRDLAKQFIDKHYPNQHINIEISQPRPGEKIHESLLDDADLEKPIIENDEMFIVLPNLDIYQQISHIQRHANNINLYKDFRKVNSENLNSYLSSQNCCATPQISHLV